MPQGLVQWQHRCDKAGRDQVWLDRARSESMIDMIIAASKTAENEDEEPVGSHIDTVINAGIYDGCWRNLQRRGDPGTDQQVQPARPIVVTRLPTKGYAISRT